MLDVRCSMWGVRCWMFQIGCSMLDVRCWMFDVGCSMLDVRCWMFDVGCSAVARLAFELSRPHRRSVAATQRFPVPWMFGIRILLCRRFVDVHAPTRCFIEVKV